jgi:hypothetical protein
LPVIATSLFAGVFASSSSVINYNLHKNIDYRKGIILSGGAVISGLFIPGFIHQINAELLKYFLTFILFIVSIQLLFEQEVKNPERVILSNFFLVPIGMFIGAISAATGIGGGVFFIPLLYYFFGLNFTKSVGTGVLAVAATMLASTISYLLHNHELTEGYIGYIHIISGLVLGFGSFFGSFFGTKLIFKINSSIIKKIFSVFLLAVILKILLSG